MLALGMACSNELEWLTLQKTLQQSIVAGVMFMTTLPVDLATIRSTVSRPWPAMLAVAIAFVFIPLVMWPFVGLFSADVGLGLMAAAVTPTTLATGAVWTRRAGGNDVIPIMVTMITNLTCFAVAPFWLWVTMKTAVDFDVPTGQIMRKLFLLVVVPMLLGQLIRRFDRAADWAGRKRPLLATVSLLGILVIVLVGATQCGLRLRAESIAPTARAAEFAGMLAVVAFVHILALSVAWRLSAWSGFDRGDAIGVSFAGSQKTLMVGLQLALLVGGGLAILPLFVYHFFQLIFDAFVADRWREADVVGATVAASKPAGP